MLEVCVQSEARGSERKAWQACGQCFPNPISRSQLHSTIHTLASSDCTSRTTPSFLRIADR